MPRPLRWSAYILAAILAAPTASAQSIQQFAPDATRYMALGDSIPAGFKAMPVTNSYAFRLYQDGVFDAIPHTLFNNAAVPGMTSAQVLAFQVPQAVAVNGFRPQYITLTVGGNDLLAILDFAAAGHSYADVLAFAQQTIAAYTQNLATILATLRVGLPDAKIFVSNQYSLPNIQAQIPYADDIVGSFNTYVAQVTQAFPTNVYLVDVYSAFLGRNNLIEGERNNISWTEVHPTNAGHRVMEQAFAAVIAAHK